MSAIQEALERARRERELAAACHRPWPVPSVPRDMGGSGAGRSRRWGLRPLMVLMAGGALGVAFFLSGSGGIPGSQGLATGLKELLGKGWAGNSHRARPEEAPRPAAYGSMEGESVHRASQDPWDTGRMLREAREMRLKGDLLGAERILRASVERDPSAVEPLVALADLYVGELGQPHMALPLYQRALLQGSPKASVLVNMGVAYLRAGEPAKATEQLLRAAQLEPDMAEVHYNLACALALQGKRLEAQRALERAASLDPRAKQWAAQDPDLASLRKR